MADSGHHCRSSFRVFTITTVKLAHLSNDDDDDAAADHSTKQFAVCFQTTHTLACTNKTGGSDGSFAAK